VTKEANVIHFRGPAPKVGRVLARLCREAVLLSSRPSLATNGPGADTCRIPRMVGGMRRSRHLMGAGSTAPLVRGRPRVRSPLPALSRTKPGRIRGH
jgi:hypothetical protein